MTMEIVGKFEWKAEESANTPLLNLTIKNTSDNKTVLISDVVWATGREDFLEGIYNTAVETLNGAAHCCYQGKVSLVEGENNGA
jgi:hypothetical protein